MASADAITEQTIERGAQLAGGAAPSPDAGAPRAVSCPRCGRIHEQAAARLRQSDYTCPPCRRFRYTQWTRRTGRIKPRAAYHKSPRLTKAPLPAEAVRFLEWCKLEKNLTANTLHAYESDLRVAAGFAGARTLLRLGKADVRELLQRRMQESSVGSVRRLRSVLIMAWKFWRDIEETTPYNPMAATVAPRGGQRLPRVLAPAEVSLLIAHAGPDGDGLAAFLRLRNQAILEITWACALRSAEVTGLGLEDVDLHAGLITIRRAKGDKDRVIPIAPLSALALQLYAEKARPRLALDRECGKVFVSRAGFPLDRRDTRRIIHAAAERAGLPAVNFHCLRHSCATALVRAGARLPVVQAFLGHSDLRATTRYIHMCPADIVEDYGRCHPRALEAAAVGLSRPALPKEIGK